MIANESLIQEAVAEDCLTLETALAVSTSFAVLPGMVFQATRTCQETGCTLDNLIFGWDSEHAQSNGHQLGVRNRFDAGSIVVNLSTEVVWLVSGDQRFCTPFHNDERSVHKIAAVDAL